MEPIFRFVDTDRDDIDNDDLKYSAGIVTETLNFNMVSLPDQNAVRTFRIGMPVYDPDNNLLGYLGIGMYNHLTYKYDDIHGEAIPYECWIICKPTKYCKEGVHIKTYWQRWYTN